MRRLSYSFVKHFRWTFFGLPCYNIIKSLQKSSNFAIRKTFLYIFWKIFIYSSLKGGNMQKEHPFHQKSHARRFLRLSMLPIVLVSIGYITSYYHALIRDPILANSQYPYFFEDILFSFFLSIGGACFLQMLEESVAD